MYQSFLFFTSLFWLGGGGGVLRMFCTLQKPLPMSCKKIFSVKVFSTELAIVSLFSHLVFWPAGPRSVDLNYKSIYSIKFQIHIPICQSFLKIQSSDSHYILTSQIKQTVGTRVFWQIFQSLVIGNSVCCILMITVITGRLNSGQFFKTGVQSLSQQVDLIRIVSRYHH